jgi:regulator of extracellular matrix RemA (YlzA/DUF370 family)
MTNEGKLLNIGYGNFVNTARMVSIVNPDSAPIRRLSQEAKDKNMLIDASCGRRTRSVIVMDSGHVVMSALQMETLAERVR